MNDGEGIVVVFLVKEWGDVHSSKDPWRAVFERWREVMDRVCKQVVDDWPSWYGEATELGLFAGAITLSGGTALLDYKHERNRGGPNEYGRPDLFAVVGDSSYCIEAKKAWPLFGDSKKWTRPLAEMTDAKEQVKCVDEVQAAKAVLCFVTPWLPVSKESALPTWLDEYLREDAAEIRDEFPAGFQVEYFPWGARGKAYKSHYFLGTTLILGFLT